MRYTDGREVPGFVVGAPLAVRGVGPYELYQLFPLDTEQETLTLVRNATAVAGLFIILGPGGPGDAGHLHDRRPGPRGGAHGPTVLVRAPRGPDAGPGAGRPGPAGGELQRDGRDPAVPDRRAGDAVLGPAAVRRRCLPRAAHTPDHGPHGGRPAPRQAPRAAPRRGPGRGAAAEPAQPVRGPPGRPVGDLAPGLRRPSSWTTRRSTCAAMAERVAGALEPLSPRSSTARWRWSGSTAWSCPCDAPRVERILANLVSNALEHGMGRPVVVEVMQEDDEAQLAVTDQGVGLTQQEITQVFTRFWRADPSRVRRVGGHRTGPVDRPRRCTGPRRDVVRVRSPRTRARPSRCACPWLPRGWTSDDGTDPHPPYAPGPPPRPGPHARGPGARSAARGPRCGRLHGLAACAAVPTSGPIEQGPVVDAGESSQFIRVIAAPPSVGAQPRPRSCGGSSRPNASLEPDHAIARRYLTARGGRSWDADAATTVYEQSSLKLSEGKDGTIMARLAINDRLDDEGTLDPVDPAVDGEDRLHPRAGRGRRLGGPPVAHLRPAAGDPGQRRRPAAGLPAAPGPLPLDPQQRPGPRRPAAARRRPEPAHGPGRTGPLRSRRVAGTGRAHRRASRDHPGAGSRAGEQRRRPGGAHRRGPGGHRHPAPGPCRPADVDPHPAARGDGSPPAGRGRALRRARGPELMDRSVWQSRSPDTPHNRAQRGRAGPLLRPRRSGPRPRHRAGKHRIAAHGPRRRGR